VAGEHGERVNKDPANLKLDFKIAGYGIVSQIPDLRNNSIKLE
jgi:hypothetical protein